MTVLHARRDVAVLEIERRQYGASAESLVFVIATDFGMLARHGRQVGRGIANGLRVSLPAGADAGTLNLHFVYLNDSGIAKSGTVSIGYVAT